MKSVGQESARLLQVAPSYQMILLGKFYANIKGWFPYRQT